ncbi:MAG: PhnD/SsuA/transferrin family substrate-binding protein [Desulfobacteraceae bacterium]|nr:PhnD/SsuA/transferrin family substrate-binding protein [Desulfobacteraceae bacterium]
MMMKRTIRQIFFVFMIFLFAGPSNLVMFHVSGSTRVKVVNPIDKNEILKKNGGSDMEIIRIAVMAKRGKEKAIKKWQPTADYLTEHIPGYKFVVCPYDWDEIRRVVANGGADFVLTNPGMYVEFETLYDVRRIATLKNLRLGKPYTSFGVVFFRRSDRADIVTYKDIEGKSLAAVEATAWGGWQVGWWQLLQMGIDPYKDLGGLFFLGSHDNVVLAVQDKKVDVGVVRTDTLERMAAEGRIDLKNFTPLWLNKKYGDSFPFWLSSKLYPEWPFATASHTPMELNERVAVVLMSIPAESRAAKLGNYEGWTVPSNYQPIHETLRKLKVTPYEHYGDITLPKVMAKYWKEFFLAVMLIIGLGFASFYFKRLNQRLTRTQELLRDELFERKQAQKKLLFASEEVQEKNQELEKTLEQINNYQDQIIMQEKMASLGSLTAGIAHEIKNPLNFVINFSELIVELVDEIKEELEDHKTKFDGENWEYIHEILGDLISNASKINEHGKRSDSIVRNMLDHSRGNIGELRNIKMNTFVDEYVKLGYYGMRANDGDFNVTINTDYDPRVGHFEVIPQDLSRVILNIVNNACYAVKEKLESQGAGFEPTLWVETRVQGNGVIIIIKDNGSGIPKEIMEKVFTPFFTTKPAGLGTGLGLSMSYDIVVQGHKGTFEVESEEGEFTRFLVGLPGAMEK